MCQQKKGLLGATCVETEGYSLCTEEAYAFSCAFCTHLRSRVTTLKNKYTTYSVCYPFHMANVHVLQVLLQNHRFFHNIKLLINMCTIRFPLSLNLEIQSSSGTILHSYRIYFFRASQECITMILYLSEFLGGRVTVVSLPKKKKKGN